jgi:hypothetical protein
VTVRVNFTGVPPEARWILPTLSNPQFQIVATALPVAGGGGSIRVVGVPPGAVLSIEGVRYF